MAKSERTYLHIVQFKINQHLLRVFKLLPDAVFCREGHQNYEATIFWARAIIDDRTEVVIHPNDWWQPTLLLQ
jgi:hypothetical protein